MIERRTYARPMYPGFFFAEEGASKRVQTSDYQEIIQQFPDRDDQLGQWFCIEVTTQNWQRWASDEGEETWKPANDNSRKSYRIYIGELLTSAQVAELPGDHEILLRNMEYNVDSDPIMRTRCGNFQPFTKNDVVIAPEGAVS